MATATFARRVGAAIISKGSSSWYDPHMEAASRAILERIPLVDLTVEIRDARIPLSSAYNQPSHLESSSKRMIVLNKMDLADRSQTQFLKFIQAQIRELKVGQSDYTATVLLIGIPNVGKSAIANSLHQIGRISAAEKGKLKHAIVSPLPGGTKDISSFKMDVPFFYLKVDRYEVPEPEPNDKKLFILLLKVHQIFKNIASHPNLYVLDTPGVLAPEVLDVEMGSKLALTGAIDDSLVGECELAMYFLAILNSNEEYKQWWKLNARQDDTLSLDDKEKSLAGSHMNKRRKQYPTDHTQDFIVRDVRRMLFSTISSFKGNLEDPKDMERLIKNQFLALHEAFRVPLEPGEDGNRTVATKLLNLYRTGRLGHYTLDYVS